MRYSNDWFFPPFQFVVAALVPLSPKERTEEGIGEEAISASSSFFLTTLLVRSTSFPFLLLFPFFVRDFKEAVAAEGGKGRTGVERVQKSVVRNETGEEKEEEGKEDN